MWIYLKRPSGFWADSWAHITWAKKMFSWKRPGIWETGCWEHFRVHPGFRTLMLILSKIIIDSSKYLFSYRIRIGLVLQNWSLFQDYERTCPEMERWQQHQWSLHDPVGVPWFVQMHRKFGLWGKSGEGFKIDPRSSKNGRISSDLHQCQHRYINLKCKYYNWMLIKPVSLLLNYLIELPSSIRDI